ncbi:MAG: hypothetical protein KDA87_15475 [Planctomycetales bacterium]|nr:hypothetical protein [Planctomycetales bacterium]
MFSSRTAVAALFASLLVWGTRINAGEPQKLFVNPFPDVCCEDLNWNWFEPIHCDCPDGAAFNSGFFFTYERLVLRASRPNEESALASIPAENILTPPPTLAEPGNVSAENSFDFSGDWTMGNRFEIGYVDEDTGGWSFGATKIDSPETFVYEDNFNRLDRAVLDLNGDRIGETFVTQNDFNMYSFELNRIFRHTPNGNNSLMIETFLGPRYVRIRDHADRADIFHEYPWIYTPVPLGPDAIILDDITSSYVNIDTFVRNLIHTDNDLFGGQFGARFVKKTSRWTLASDVRGFAFNNFRSRERTILVERNRQLLEPVSGSVSRVILDNTRDFTYEDSNHFVWGGELHLNATYSLTKTIGLQAGFQTIIFADGIGRGMFTTDEMFALTGGSFGFTINR